MDQVEYILDEFAFDDVWQAMRTVGWRWGTGVKQHYPTFTELRRMARQLLEAAAKEQTRYASGGLEATYEDGVLELRFVLASASSEECDDSDMP